MDVSLATSLIPLAVPVIIAGVKWAIPKVPKMVLPVLAPVLGLGIELLAHYVGGLSAGSPWVGAAAGAFGLVLREAYDQAKKALDGAVVPPSA